jgi:hypothetical protein
MLNPQFGSGVLFGIPNAGNLAANPTPIQYGILQEVSVEFKSDTKKLFGMYQLPVAVARGKITVSGKGKIAALDPTMYSQLYFGQPSSAGTVRVSFSEKQTASSSVSTTQITASVDLGVVAYNSVSGISAGTQLTAITTGTPTTGQYKFVPYSSTGPTDASYVFAAADVTAGLVVLLNYQYPVTGSGVTLSIANQLMGYAPQFTALLWNSFRGAQFAVQLNACMMGSLSLPTKQEDFWISDFDMEAFTDASNNLGVIYSDQA